jgi:hypothetical protein
MPPARTSVALVAVAIVAVAGAYALGSRRSATETTVAPRDPVAAPAAGAMDEAAFWRLVADTRAAAYLISLGRASYETGVRDPDALAPTVEDAETGDWESADDVAPDAYQSVTGEDIPGDSSDLSGDPRGTPWDDDHAEVLVQRYPRLAARFR